MHTGLEFDFTAKPLPNLDFRGFASVGNWEYKDEVVSTTRDQDRRVLKVDRADVDGGKVGDAAQFSAGAGFKYTIVERFSVDADYRFYDKIYSNVGAVKNNLELPSYGLVDSGLSYRALVGNSKKQSLDFRLNVNNLFHKIYLSELRTNIKTTDRINPTVEEDLRTYESEGRVINGVADTNQGFYGLGRTWNFTVKYNF